MENIDKFCEDLKEHTIRKKRLYDGVNKEMSTEYALGLAIEELGEIAGALTRSRYKLAEYECIDLAHCAFLIKCAIDEMRT